MVVTDGICIEDCGTQISRPFISVCREVDLIAYFIKLRYGYKIIRRNKFHNGVVSKIETITVFN